MQHASDRSPRGSSRGRLRRDRRAEIGRRAAIVCALVATSTVAVAQVQTLVQMVTPQDCPRPCTGQVRCKSGLIAHCNRHAKPKPKCYCGSAIATEDSESAPATTNDIR